ncbi:transcriptional regulator [Solibacillus sp. R5-41]|uniref:MurR/RpiR family transcriptional regulator n=1 Tax=Solibacillus sp. R5-41 TaxID=2048654 RepID=UPI000C127797|nr:MurR/RpiR family transcriptional regulator [Solibacillus sp. R5-41]ATP42077.1 transcriptional regulator [Solibacillus sp. R5-41]
MRICEEIKKKFIHLSKGQRKVAQFIMDNPNVVATQIASEVGRQAGVSESTVIRFCYAMDLSGFSDLQNKVRENLIHNGETSLKKKSAPVSKVENNVCSAIVKQNIDGISKTFNQLNEQQFEEVVQLLHSTKKVHLLGFRQSAPASFWLYNNMAMLRDHVYFIEHEADKIVQQLTLMDEDSLLIIISLDDEYEDIITTVEIAKRKKVKIVAIRDKKLIAVKEPADKVLIVPSAQEGGATCTIVIFALLHALVESMVIQNPKQYEGFRKKLIKEYKSAKLIEIGKR